MNHSLREKSKAIKALNFHNKPSIWVHRILIDAILFCQLDFVYKYHTMSGYMQTSSVCFIKCGWYRLWSRKSKLIKFRTKLQYKLQKSLSLDWTHDLSQSMRSADHISEWYKMESFPTIHAWLCKYHNIYGIISTENYIKHAHFYDYLHLVMFSYISISV